VHAVEQGRCVVDIYAFKDTSAFEGFKFDSARKRFATLLRQSDRERVANEFVERAAGFESVAPGLAEQAMVESDRYPHKDMLTCRCAGVKAVEARGRQWP
ncbi:MAG: hypothetical protein ACREC6_11580, partial [Hyphomicrobiaceae bacterium]